MTVDNPANGDYTVSADEAASGKIQRVKLTYSADGSDTHVQADADGVLVNLGANNDVTVTGTVNVGTALPAGTNNIGDVDVLSIVPGTGATNLGKAEDAPHSSGDVGVMALGVAVTTSGGRAASGDYVPLDLDVNGRLRVVGAVAADSAVSGDVIVVGAQASWNTPSTVSADGDAVRLWADRSGRLIAAERTNSATTVSVSAATSSQLLAGAGSFRTLTTVYNDSTANLYVRLGASASTSTFTVKLGPGDYYEVPAGFAGQIHGIWDAAAGQAMVTEIS